MGERCGTGQVPAMIYYNKAESVDKAKLLQAFQREYVVASEGRGSKRQVYLTWSQRLSRAHE